MREVSVRLHTYCKEENVAWPLVNVPVLIVPLDGRVSPGTVAGKAVDHVGGAAVFRRSAHHCEHALSAERLLQTKSTH